MNTPTAGIEMSKEEVLWLSYDKRNDLKAKYILGELERLKKITDGSVKYKYNFENIFSKWVVNYLEEIANNIWQKLTENVFVTSCDSSVPEYEKALKLMKEQIIYLENSEVLEDIKLGIGQRIVDTLRPKSDFLKQIDPSVWIEKK